MWLVELYLVKHGQKLLQRHVGGYGVGLAVAAAVEAVHVATQRTLPKQLAQGMKQLQALTLPISYLTVYLLQLVHNVLLLTISVDACFCVNVSIRKKLKQTQAATLLQWRWR